MIPVLFCATNQQFLNKISSHVKDCTYSQLVLLVGRRQTSVVKSAHLGIGGWRNICQVDQLAVLVCCWEAVQCFCGEVGTPANVPKPTASSSCAAINFLRL